LAYESIPSEVLNSGSGLFFPDTPDGIRKTFFISLLLVYIRSLGAILVVLTLALSSNAATLMDGRRTAHSVLKLSLDTHFAEVPTGLFLKIQ